MVFPFLLQYTLSEAPWFLYSRKSQTPHIHWETAINISKSPQKLKKHSFLLTDAHDTDDPDADDDDDAADDPSTNDNDAGSTESQNSNIYW